MFPEVAAWLIIWLPLAAAVLAVVIRLLPPKAWPFSGYVVIVGVGATFILSVWALQATLSNGTANYSPHPWFTIGNVAAGTGFAMTVGVFLDPLTAIMVVIVSGVSLLVQIYSLGYMRNGVVAASPNADAHAATTIRHDSSQKWGDYPRYFTYMAIFTAAMLGLVLSYNLIELFVFWELVGLTSYLLIGFWYHRPAAAAAAKKSFIVTRLGDFGFLLAIIYLFFNRAQFSQLGLNPFSIPDILKAAPVLSAGLVTWVSLGMFAGAVGKSAQFPLNTWLPDAMEGPTPVSSFIHAATMVAAGVFLVARMFPLFQHSAAALNTVAIIGGASAFLAAAMGLVSNDIKRVLAFSTVSQLGYMFLALGVGAPVVAIFHLFNHAFFKCLLFLGAGSVHHSANTFDMRYMGGMRKWMPVTYAATLIAGLSLAGIFPFSGFWSKDGILAAAWSGHAAANVGVSQFVFWLGLIAAFLTAFYIMRLIILTFHGEFRGGIDAIPQDERLPDEAHAHVHRSESPVVMAFPMVVLGALALGSGFFANPTVSLGVIPSYWFSHFLQAAPPSFNIAISSLSTGVAFVGLGVAFYLYGVKRRISVPLSKPAALVHQVLARRYYMDDFYEDFLVRRVAYRGLFLAADWVDRRIVDGIMDLIGWLGRNTGRAVAQLQTGQVQVYGVAVSMGVIVLLMLYLFQW